MKKSIDIILPYKEIFNKNKASAVSLTILNSFKFCKFKKNIRIFVLKKQSLSPVNIENKLKSLQILLDSLPE